MREDILRYFSTAKASVERNHSNESITTILGQLDVAAPDEADEDANDPLSFQQAITSLLRRDDRSRTTETLLGFQRSPVQNDSQVGAKAAAE